MDFLQSMARCVFGKSCGFKGKASPPTATTPQKQPAAPQPERLVVSHPWRQKVAAHLTDFTRNDLNIHVPTELVDLCVQFARPSTEWNQERLQSVGQKTWTQHTASTLGRILAESRDVVLPQDVLELCVSFARHDGASAASSSTPSAMHHRAASHTAPQIPAVSTTRFELGRAYEVTVRLNVDHVLKSPYASAYGGRVFGGFVPSAHIDDMWCHPPAPTDRQVANPKKGITFRLAENERPSASSAASSSSSSSSSSRASSASPAATPRTSSTSTSSSSSSSSSHSSQPSPSPSTRAVWRESSSSSSSSSPAPSRCTASVPTSISSSDPYTVRWVLDARQKTHRTAGGMGGGFFGCPAASSAVEREPLSLRAIDANGFVTRQIVDFQPHHFPLLFASNDPNVFQILKVESDVDVARYPSY